MSKDQEIRIFSGIRPSGKLHLGNYLGAIKNWLALSEAEGIDQAIFAVVDYHGITTPYDPKTYQKQIMDVILDYLAAGVDPEKALLIRQSKVQQHTELAWIFSTITPVGWLERLPNYREKVKEVKNIATPGLGVYHTSAENSRKIEVSHSYEHNLSLLAYPVLMAADILLYKSNLVPVGEDQLAHLNITNEIGNKFNHLFCEVFPNVKAHIAQGARIMSLQDPTKKMSKTGDEGIALSDGPDTIMEKIKKATTDSEKEIIFNEESKPGISNLLTIYSLLSGKEIKSIEKDYNSKTYVHFKNDLAEVVISFLKPFQEKRKGFEKDVEQVEAILENSEEKAINIAAKTMKEVKEKMGLL